MPPIHLPKKNVQISKIVRLGKRLSKKEYRNIVQIENKQENNIEIHPS
jgi:hypothetical protein